MFKGQGPEGQKGPTTADNPRHFTTGSPHDLFILFMCLCVSCSSKLYHCAVDQSKGASERGRRAHRSARPSLLCTLLTNEPRFNANMITFLCSLAETYLCALFSLCTLEENARRASRFGVLSRVAFNSTLRHRTQFGLDSEARRDATGSCSTSHGKQESSHCDTSQMKAQCMVFRDVKG